MLNLSDITSLKRLEEFIILKRVLTLLLCFTLMFFLVECDNSNTDASDEDQDKEEVVEEVESDTDTSKEETSSNDNYTVGSLISDQGVTVTLNSVTQSTGGSYSTPAEGNVYLIIANRLIDFTYILRNI